MRDDELIEFRFSFYITRSMGSRVLSTVAVNGVSVSESRRMEFVKRSAGGVV